MSRSRRKTPIFGRTAARSEADDKRLWHKSWRAKQREQLASATSESEITPVSHRAASSPWRMAKDGKSWFGPRRQEVAAERMAAGQGKTGAEREALQARMLAKWCSK